MNSWPWYRHRNLLAGFMVFSALITFAVGVVVIFQKKGVSIFATP